MLRILRGRLRGNRQRPGIARQSDIGGRELQPLEVHHYDNQRNYGKVLQPELKGRGGETIVGRVDCRGAVLHQLRRHTPSLRFGAASFGEDYTSISDANYATETSTPGPISAFGSDVQEIVMVSSSGRPGGHSFAFRSFAGTDPRHNEYAEEIRSS